MSNPFKPHASHQFADRESIDAVMIYVNNVVNSMEPGQDRIAATTAIMILVNTAAKLWPEASIPAPGAVELELRLEALAERVSELEQSRPPVTDVVVQVIQSEIEAWADDNFNNLADDWLRNHADLDSDIENWIEMNLDIENEVREVLSSANLSITF